MSADAIAPSSRRRSRTDLLIALVVLAAFWVLFYLPIWRGHRYIGWDLVRYNFPLDRYILAHIGLHKGLPLYDPFTYNGVSFIGNIQAEILYPPKLLMDLGLKLLGRQLTVPIYEGFLLLHVLIFSVGVYLVAKRFTRSWWLAIAGALTVSYAGFFQGQLEHLWYFTTLAWAPFAFFGLWRAIRELKGSGTAIYIVASVFMLLAGYPLLFVALQLLIVGGVVVAAWVGGERPRRVVIVRLMLSWVTILLLAAPIVLPFLFLARTAIADVARPNFSVRTLLSGFAPNSLGALSGDYSVPGTDLTNGYYFAGAIFFVAPIAAVFLAWRPATRKTLAAFVAALTLCGLIVFTPLTSKRHVVSVFRSWMFAGVFFILLVALVMYAATLAFQKGRWWKIAIVAVGLISIAFEFHYSEPGYFNTLPGSARAPSLQHFVIGDAAIMAAIQADSPTFSMLVDAGSVRQKFEGWPRIVGIRSTSGFDPTAPKAYMQLVYKEARLGGRPQRLLVVSRLPDTAWLADNGVKYIISSADKFFPPPKGLKTILQGDSYDVLELAGARPLISSDGCARISGLSLDGDSISFQADVLQPGCTLRATTNYSANWHVNDAAARIEPIAGALGFTVGPFDAGTHHVALRYHDRAFEAGLVLFLIGVILFVALLMRSRRSDNRPTTRGATDPHPVPAGVLGGEGSSSDPARDGPPMVTGGKE